MAWGTRLKNSRDQASVGTMSFIHGCQINLCCRKCSPGVLLQFCCSQLRSMTAFVRRTGTSFWFSQSQGQAGPCIVPVFILAHNDMQNTNRLRIAVLLCFLVVISDQFYLNLLGYFAGIRHSYEYHDGTGSPDPDPVAQEIWRNALHHRLCTVFIYPHLGVKSIGFGPRYPMLPVPRPLRNNTGEELLAEVRI